MRLTHTSAVVALLGLLTVPFVAAAGQDLGEIARQQRQRHASLPAHAPVLTNDDLRRERILPDAPPGSSKPAPAKPDSGLSNVPLWSVADQPGFSLGEYARAWRRARAARDLAAGSAGSLAPAASAKGATPSVSAGLPMPVPPQPLRSRKSADVARQPAGTLAESQPRIVRVTRGDSLWRISRVHLGRGSLWRLVWQSNPAVSNPERIEIGQAIRLPPSEAVEHALSHPRQIRARNANEAALAVARNVKFGLIVWCARREGTSASGPKAASWFDIDQRGTSQEIQSGNGHTAMQLLRESDVLAFERQQPPHAELAELHSAILQHVRKQHPLGTLVDVRAGTRRSTEIGAWTSRSPHR
jgi:hypothetical protein